MADIKLNIDVFSKDSLEAAINALTAYKQKVEELPDKLVAQLTERGRARIYDELVSIYDLDGNYNVSTGFTYDGKSEAEIFIDGEQAAYLEYGTGTAGLVESHPKANEANWQYGSGSYIRNSAHGSVYWVYKDRQTGKRTVTYGIPAYMPVLKTSIYLKSIYADLARGMMKD